MENIEKKLDNFADLLGIPKDVQDDIKRMAIIQARITACLRTNKAISKKDTEEYNRMCYKHFPCFQDGAEFEKEETEIEKNRCPKAVAPADNFTLDFGAAIRSVKQGYRCARKGWNGKGQYIQLACNISYMTEGGKLANARHSAIGNKAIAFVGTSGTQIGWLASQADMLAEDWYIVRD